MFNIYFSDSEDKICYVCAVCVFLRLYRKAELQQCLYWPTANPEVCSSLTLPDFKTMVHMNVERLILHFVRLYPHGTHFCQRLCRTQRHSAGGRIETMTNSNDSLEPATFRLVAQCLGQRPHRHCLLSSMKKTVWYSAVTECCDQVNIRGQTQPANLTNLTTEFQ
jgi:hypothetical protein